MMPTAVWDPTANNGQGGYIVPNSGPAAATGVPTSSTAAVYPGMSYEQWLAEQQLAAGQLGVNQTQAQTGQQNAYTTLLNDIITAYPAYHGPQSWATYANFVTGQPNSGTLGFYDAAAGRTAPFTYGTVNDQTPLDPFDFESNVNGPYPNDGSGSSSTSADGSSGPSKIDWKNERAAAGISADASNPEVDRQFESGQPVTDPAALAALTVNEPKPASDFTGNRDTEGNPVENKPVYDPAVGGYTNTPPATPPENKYAGGGNPYGYAQGGMSLIRQPTTVNMGGQPVQMGEGGRDELMMVLPLQNKNVAVSPLIAKIAEQMVHGNQGYRAHGGMPPGMMNQSPGVSPVHMDTGGMLYGGSTGSTGGQVSPGATVTPAGQPYDNGQYISDTGQAKVPNAGGGYDEVPAYQTLPVLNPLQQNPSQMSLILNNPDLLAMLQSTMENQGQSWSSWYAAYANSLPTQNRAPTAARYSRGAF